MCDTALTTHTLTHTHVWRISIATLEPILGSLAYVPFYRPGKKAVPVERVLMSACKLQLPTCDLGAAGPLPALLERVRQPERM